MTTIPSELGRALRRMRLEAALALAEQQGMPDEVRARLGAELGHLVEDVAAHRGGPRLYALIRRLDLQPVDELALLAAAALELDPLFAVTASALAGGEQRTGINNRLFALVMRFGGDEAMALQLDGEHPLIRAGLLEVTDAAVPRTLGGWRIGARTLAHLCGSDALSPLLRRCGSVLEAPAGASFEYAAATWKLLEQSLAGDSDAVICIEGLEGVGRRSLAAAVMAAGSGRSIVALDASRASTEPAVACS